MMVGRNGDAARVTPLRNPEPDFRALFESAPGLYLVLTPDPSFTITAVSDAYARATMTKRDEILGKRLFDVFPDNPADPFATGTRNLRASLDRVLANRNPDRMAVQKYDIRRPVSEGGDFEERFWSPLNTPVLDQKGEVTAIIHQVEDVTENVRLIRRGIQQDEEISERVQQLQAARVQLQDYETRFRILVEGVKDYAIYMLDPAGRVNTWNAGAKRLKGYDESEIIGQHFSKFFTEEDISKGRPDRDLQDAVRWGRSEENGWRVRKDGTQFWVNTIITALHDANGGLIGFAKITRDLTAQLKAEEERSRLALLEQVRQSEKTLDQIFNESPSFMTLTLGPDHVFTRANQQYYEVLQLDPSIIGRNVREVFPEIETQGFIALLDQVYKTGVPYRAIEAPLRLECSDGTERHLYVDFAYQPLRDAEGKVYGLIHQGYETTQKVLVRRELEKAVRARDEFISLASHELRTPLTALKLMVQMRKRSIARGDPSAFEPLLVKKVVDDYDKQITRLARLVDDMLDMSRINTGKFQLAPERFDLCALVRDVVERFTPQLESIGIKITVDAPDTVYGCWDRYRIEQVFTNLLTNAVKYGRGKPISVAVTETAERVCLLVRDEGIGIAEKDQDRIFNQFERAVPLTGVTGLGLGLFIVKQLVEAHGGTVRVESEVGKGSTFAADMPLNGEQARGLSLGRSDE